MKLYRKRLGLTQEGLAFKCLESQEDALANRSYISDIENCRRNITLDKIERLAAALEVEPFQLFVTQDQKERI